MEGNYKKWINRINSKQDVLTEDNVGEFMLSELSTKSAPTSGDTILAMDSVTGKAVKIPTDQLGGNVDLTTKLDKGTYTGTAQDLKNAIDNKADINHTHPDLENYIKELNLTVEDIKELENKINENDYAYKTLEDKLYLINKNKMNFEELISNKEKTLIDLSEKSFNIEKNTLE